MSSPSAGAGAPPRSGPRTLLWCVGGSLVIFVLVCAGMIVYNRQDHLTPENLARARAAWAAAGIASYDIEVTVQGTTSGTYAVQVRNDKIVKATFNGQPFVPLERAEAWTVPGLFEVVLDQDLKTDARLDRPPASTRVRFDPADGHLIEYVRTSGTQNLMIEVTLTPIP